MTPTSEEILALMRSIGERPAFYGSARAGHGLILSFATIVLKEELGRDLGVCLSIAYGLVFMATEDVARLPELATELCDETLIPDARHSHEALTRHTNTFLQLLVKHIELGAADPSSIERVIGSRFGNFTGAPLAAEGILAYLKRTSKPPPEVD